MIYGGKGRSIPQRIVMMTAQTVILGVTIWLLVGGGLEWLSGAIHRDWADMSFGRRIALTVCCCVAYARLAVTVLYLLKRALGWEEALSVAFAFILYYVGFTLFAAPVSGALGAGAVIGIVLFAVGSTINTVSELLRDRWKADPAHTRKLYTGGLFRYAMHINYFGDVVWVGGLALLTGNPWSAIVPVLLFCFFAFYNAPLLDRHLAEKYGADFEEYRRHTRRIIPFVY